MQPIQLTKHPEGGQFAEVFRSDAIVSCSDGQSRSALTHIYFALEKDEVSRFHKVSSDEAWNLYQGEGLYLYTWDGSDTKPQRHELSAKAHCFCHVVPAGIWQAAEPMGKSALAGCSVGPGFEFTDFELMDPLCEQAQQLQSLSPDLDRLVTP